MDRPQDITSVVAWTTLRRYGLPWIYPGSIVGFLAPPIVRYLQPRVMQPATDRQHFLVIRGFIPEIGDFEFVESTTFGFFTKGVRNGYLFADYGGSDVEIYEVDCPINLRKLAALELIKWGKSPYDYLFVLRTILGIPVAEAKILMKEHRPRRVRAEDLPYVWDDSLACTEAAWVAYNMVAVNVIPAGVPALPCAYKQAELDGQMRCYWKGTLPCLESLV